MSYIRLHFLGDHGIGKTSLIVTYTSNYCPTNDDLPYLTKSDLYYKDLVIEKKKEIRLAIQDMGGCDYGYKKLRCLLYDGVDVFAICFSFDSPKSLQNAINIWIPEIKESCPNVPFILVGLKSDLKDSAINQPPWRLNNSNMKLIPNSTCENLKDTVDADYYIECSSKNKINVDDVFVNAVKSVLKLENITENKAENKTENKAENITENKAENKTENKAENITENKAENKIENTCCYIS